MCGAIVSDWHGVSLLLSNNADIYGFSIVNRSGAAVGGSAYQDALEHIHVSLILDILSRKVLVSTTTHHS